MWWDLLAHASGGQIPPDVRQEALDSCAGRTDKVLQWADSHGFKLADMPEHARTATESELQRAACQSGISVGSHSWSHPNLARLDSESLAGGFEDGPSAWEASFPGGVDPAQGQVVDRLERALARAERITATTEASLAQFQAVEKHLAALTGDARRLINGLGNTIEHGRESLEQVDQRLGAVLDRAPRWQSGLGSHQKAPRGTQIRVIVNCAPAPCSCRNEGRAARTMSPLRVRRPLRPTFARFSIPVLISAA